MDYDKARQELSDSRHNTSPAAKADIVARIAAEATLSIAESLARLSDSLDAAGTVPAAATPQPEQHQYVVGDRARVIGDLSLRVYWVDEVLDDGLLVLLDDERGTVAHYPKNLIYIDHPRDEPIAADDDVEGDWHEEAVAGGISALKAKADKKAKRK